MNIKVLLVLCMFLLSYPAIAQDETCNGTNENIQQPNKNQQPNVNPGGSESDWDIMYDETIYERYGSTESPAFLNREEMNPNEGDYGYEGAGNGG